MSQPKTNKSKFFSTIEFLFFDRKRALIFCLMISLLSLFVELCAKTPTIFSCSGAIFTLAGLFLNIKHNFYFHLGLPKLNLFNIISGAGTFGTAELTHEQEAKVDDFISDEKYGIAFMVVGTLIWAYGSLFLEFLFKHL